MSGPIFSHRGDVAALESIVQAGVSAEYVAIWERLAKEEAHVNDRTSRPRAYRKVYRHQRPDLPLHVDELVNPLSPIYGNPLYDPNFRSACEDD